MTKVANIAKNTSYLTLALILQKVISFSYFTFLARNLGPESLGKYYFAISFVTIFAVFIDFGMINVLTREVAKKQEDAKRILGSILSLKILLSFVVLLVIFIVINLMDYPILTTRLVYLASLCVILDSFTNTFYGVIRGFHNLKFESIASIIFQLIVFIFGLAALYSGFSLLWVMGALLLASIFNFLFSFFTLLRKINIVIKPIFNYRIMKSVFILAAPFGLFAIFQRVYMYLDTVLLSFFAGDKFVGLYQVAFKIIFALQFLPMAFVASLYPAMSSYWVNNKEQLSITFERALIYLTIISLPISVGVITLADKIIFLFKSDYLEAVLPIQIIMASLLFMFLNFPIGSLLNACDKQKVNTFNMGATVVLSIVLNLILIPKFQAVGASITVLVTNLFMFVLNIYWAPKILDFKFGKFLMIFFKVLVAALIMGLAAVYLKAFLNIFFVIVICGLIYFVLLFVFKGFSKEDIQSIYRSFIKKDSR
jgi:O-antigen/teichoic acid export membrane protein